MLLTLTSARHNRKRVVKMKILRQKKATVSLSITTLLLVALMVVLLIVGVLLIWKYYFKASDPVSRITSCGGLMGDQNACCDCYFEERCPGGEMGVLNEGCPKGACTADNFADKAGKAYTAYEREKEAHEEKYGRLDESVRRNLMAKHFGRCCSDVECPAGAG